MEKKISFTGDIMCKREFLQHAKDVNGNWNFSDYFDSLKPLFSKSDLVIGNLETPVAGEALGYVKEEFSFNAPIEFAQAVKDAGIGYVSTANNHLADRGREGVIATCKNLREIGLAFSGTRISNSEPRGDILDVDGLRIGILCYAHMANRILYNSRHINFLQDRKRWTLIQRRLKSWFRAIRRRIPGLKKPRKSSESKARGSKIVAGAIRPADMSPTKYVTKRRKHEIIKEIQRLRKVGADIIVVYAHMGGQYNIRPEKRVIDYSNWFLEQGVNAVVVNHEHLVQEADFSKLETNNQFVTYCLGNFLGGAGVYYPPFNQQIEYSVVLHMYVDEDTKHIRCAFSPLKTVQTGDGKFRVVPVFELISECQDEKEKNKLIADNLLVYNRFMNTEKESVEIALEYPCEK